METPRATDRVRTVKVELRLSVNIDGYNREYGGDDGVNDVKRDVRRTIEDGVRDSILRHLDHIIDVQYENF